jgi:hypothetical protein
MYLGLHKYTRYSCQILIQIQIQILDRFSKNAEISNLMKIRSVGAELCKADGLTDRQTDRCDEVPVAFRSFANAPNNRREGLYVYTTPNYSVTSDLRKDRSDLLRAG